MPNKRMHLTALRAAGDAPSVMLLSDAMNELPRIEAEVTFLPESEGGRKQPPQLSSGGQYRPHLVVGDPNQRQAVTIGNENQETYLGVAFVSGPSNVESGKSFQTELVLMYWPHPMYESLVPGVTFTMREGARIVGYGRVKRISPTAQHNKALQLTRR